MLHKEIKYTYNDVQIVPSVLTSVEHRSDCNPYDKEGYLPIFAAPMSTVVSMDNFDILEKNKIHAIVPRNYPFDFRVEKMKSGLWTAFSLAEFESIFINEKESYQNKMRVLIDIANGHMEHLYKTVRKVKDVQKNLTIMIGNIANPEAYRQAYNCGADYVRVGIGGGEGCWSSTMTGVHYPMASLVDEVANVRHRILSQTGRNKDELPKIIADGGIRSFVDINKALALGADYVMIGGQLSSLLESPAATYKMSIRGDEEEKEYTFDEIVKYIKKDENGFYDIRKVEKKPIALVKVFYGMASNEGSKDLGKGKNIAPEGCVKNLFVKYTTQEWTEIFTKYLQSAMSYCDAGNLRTFNPHVIVISQAAQNAINKA